MAFSSGPEERLLGVVSSSEDEEWVLLAVISALSSETDA
jgi:hypothetical protein